MKQVILVRKDLKLSRGKLASQCSHASVEAVLKSDKEKINEWRKFSKKVVLKVRDEKELLDLKKLADREKLVTALIKDAGRTEIKPGTITCLAIGPDEDKKIDKITGKLKIL
ncbi:MAG: Peptidyl-tRNA hydrolase [archaeon GW2011_AR20]|nr:MAG: Peptidyl-tRNA hydrolase [archaeon GW2011_AR20]MBS3160862.1 peptidyl-tRNA hydrolase Pth2 [Candidatus Woesearchaeota archaeon]